MNGPDDYYYYYYYYYYEIVAPQIDRDNNYCHYYDTLRNAGFANTLHYHPAGWLDDWTVAATSEPAAGSHSSCLG
jgi:hypothetical protein